MEKSFSRHSYFTLLILQSVSSNLRSWILISLQTSANLIYGVGGVMTAYVNICHWTLLQEKSTVQDLPKMEFKNNTNSNNNNRSGLNVSFVESLTNRFNQILGFSKAGCKIPTVTFYCKCCFPCYPWEQSTGSKEIILYQWQYLFYTAKHIVQAAW